MADYSNLTVEEARNLCFELTETNRNLFDFLSSLGDNERITVVDFLISHSLLNEFDIPTYSPDAVRYRLRNILAFVDCIVEISLVDPVIHSHFISISERLEQLGVTE